MQILNEMLPKNIYISYKEKGNIVPAAFHHVAKVFCYYLRENSQMLGWFLQMICSRFVDARMKLLDASIQVGLPACCFKRFS